MSRKARHLQAIKDSQKEEYNIEKPSKTKTRLEIIQDARHDDARQQANLYALSLGKPAPNKLSYEKGGKKRKRYTLKSKNKKNNKTKRRK
jgi:hypothetical protein